MVGGVLVARPEILLLEVRRTVGLRESVEGRRIARRQRRLLVRQARQSRQPEDRVDRLDHRVVVALGVRDRAGAGEGRDQHQRDAHAARQRQAVRPVGQNARRHVIVEPVRLVIGDDDRALAPDLRARGDGVDDAGVHRLGDLVVGIAGMIVVAGLGGVDRGDFRHASAPPGRDSSGSGSAAAGLEVVVAAADVDHAAGRRQVVVVDVVEEVVLALQVVPFVEVVGDVAEILRAVVVRDIVGVRRGRREGRLVRLDGRRSRSDTSASAIDLPGCAAMNGMSFWMSAEIARRASRSPDISVLMSRAGERQRHRGEA